MTPPVTPIDIQTTNSAAMAAMRRTKIIATLGPATDSAQSLAALIKAGADVVRINFSHGTPDEQRNRVAKVREVASTLGREVAILADLQGPKIRVERFSAGVVDLVVGGLFILDADCPANGGDETRVGIAYKSLPQDLSSGDILLLDDGHIVLKVTHIKSSAVHCEVIVGGKLSDKKGINRLGGGLSAKALTAKDLGDIKLAAELAVDYVALSFPRSADDVNELRSLLELEQCRAGIVAKIERAEAVAAAEEIIRASDAIMVARGDLGVELGDAELPAVQKSLIRQARALDRAVITATQMMQSMVDSPIPTRAEVFDVANAVLDGTDAVMLSQETAVGCYPVQTVEAMVRVCCAAERQRKTMISGHRMESTFERIDEAIAMATMYTANHLGVKAIAALTESGDTPLWMSRISSGIPIYALTPHPTTQRRVTLYRGVYPVELQLQDKSHAVANRAAIMALLDMGAVEDGDLVIVTKGDLSGVHGGTNSMKIIRVGDIHNATDE